MVDYCVNLTNLFFYISLCGLVNEPFNFLTTDCVENIDAQRVFGYALFKDGRDTKLSYPLEKFHSDVSGRSFHNGRFIQRMREKAATLPKYVFSHIADFEFVPSIHN